MLAILVPFVCAGISIFVASTFWTLTTVIDSGSAEGVGPSEVANPLLPAWYDFGWMALMLLGLLLVPASGLWLLWRLRGRTSR